MSHTLQIHFVGVTALMMMNIISVIVSCFGNSMLQSTEHRDLGSLSFKKSMNSMYAV